jgi:hypothetical protein
MGEMRNVYNILGGKSGGKRTVGRSRRILEDNIKTNFKELGM